MGRDENIAVFKDTEKLCKTISSLRYTVLQEMTAISRSLNGY